MILRLVGANKTHEMWFPSSAPRVWGDGINGYSSEYDLTYIELINMQQRINGVFYFVGMEKEHPSTGSKCKFLVYTTDKDQETGFIWDENRFDAYLMNDDGKTYQRLS